MRQFKLSNHPQFVAKLRDIVARIPVKLTVHVIIDNYATRKHPMLLEWLAHHPRFVFHFTPTSASLNWPP